MKKAAVPLVLALAVSAIAWASPAKAQTYPWCAVYGGIDGDNGTNCGFDTLQQCRATISGIGGWCQQNPLYQPREQPRPPRSSRPSR